MARTHVFLRLPDGDKMVAKTDLHGHGVVSEGDEFTARECGNFGGGDRLMKSGRKLLVKVRRVERVGQSYHVLHVEVLKDLSPKPTEQKEMFGL